VRRRKTKPGEDIRGWPHDAQPGQLTREGVEDQNAMDKKKRKETRVDTRKRKHPREKEKKEDNRFDRG
jgi:hypothetical protein